MRQKRKEGRVKTGQSRRQEKHLAQIGFCHLFEDCKKSLEGLRKEPLKIQTEFQHEHDFSDSARLAFPRAENPKKLKQVK